MITTSGRLIAWDLIQSLQQPILTMQMCNESLTTLAPYDEGTYIAIGNSVGKVFLVESMEFLQSFDRKDRGALSEVNEREINASFFRCYALERVGLLSFASPASQCFIRVFSGSLPRWMLAVNLILNFLRYEEKTFP